MLQNVFSPSMHSFVNIRVLLLLMLLMTGFMSPTMALSLAPGPVITISTWLQGPNARPTRIAAINSSYQFNTHIEYQGGFLIKNDLYFGVLLPGNAKVFTWGKNGEYTSLQANMVPILKGIDMKDKLSLDVGTDIQYTFTGNETPGMYIIFSMLVIANTDPTDPRNWFAIEMQPLFFNP